MDTSADMTFVKAILFDLDGTLLNTLQDLADSMNEVLTARGLPGHPVPEYRYFVGDGMRELARRVYPGNNPPEEMIDLLVEEMRIEYGKRCYDTTGPYEGVDEMLEYIAGSGVPMAVFSNKPHEFTMEMVAYYFKDIPFRVVMGVNEWVPRKPDPAGALMISKKIGIEPKNFLYLGDTATDMNTATSSGMYPAGAAWGFRDEQELRHNGAQIILDTPRQLTRMLKKVFNTK